MGWDNDGVLPEEMRELLVSEGTECDVCNRRLFEGTSIHFTTIREVGGGERCVLKGVCCSCSAPPLAKK